MTINQKVEEAYVESLQKQGNLVDTDNTPMSDEDVLDILRDNVVSELDRDSHRWWDQVEKVSKLGDRYFTFYDAETTGDTSAWEAGWEFDINSVEEVEPYEETVVVTKYRRKA